MKYSGDDLLEFEALKQLLSRYVSSALGRAGLEAIAPGTDRALLEAVHAETAEAMAYLDTAARPQPAARGAAVRLRFDTLPDSTGAARRLRIEGAALDGREIYQLTEVLDRAADVRMVLDAARERFPRLAARAARIGEFRPVLRDIAGKILPDGTLADHASVALGRLRRDIERQRKSIQDSLERFLRAHRQDGVLQEEFVAIRNDRFVVPIVAGRERRVEGVVHGASGSGHTLFVEPFESIELNNELVRLREEELREAARILRELTERLRRHAAAIAESLEVLGELDLLFGKAQFAAEFGAVIPRFSPPGARRLALREARHPLLEDVLRRRKMRVVPVTVELTEERRTLLISGPNTGGKTVSLKTVGLLALMAQSGLPVTCAEAEFPLFDQVLADIGDNQSIQESLSTFSAHVTRVRDMEADVTADSLVLLDELGRATDPEEGGALGVALVERFRAAGAFTLASTHLLALKVYGATTPGVENGSMGFDEETLEPTYVLRLGAPGKSAGLDIAGRLGVPRSIIDRARAAMTTGERDLARLIGELHQRLAGLSEERLALKEAQAGLAAREKAVEHEWAQREAAKIKEIERRSDLLMQRFESQAQETIAGIFQTADQRKAAGQAQRKVSRAKREFRETLETTVLSTREDARQGELDGGRPRLAEGVRVRLRNVREPARVRRLLAHDLIEVEAGFLKMQVSADDVLEVLDPAPEAAKLPSQVTLQAGPRWNVSYREINLIGKRAEEACELVDKFLDDAAMASVDRVRIVHGHGMGILRKSVAELLASHPHVDKFYPAPPSEGGTGATVAELKPL
ncbi:MAG: Smr/MutS family protein [Acidobacteria bacterium]|nr:Smr/MutS family protein [Acidobacteriota bacterium]